MDLNFGQKASDYTDRVIDLPTEYSGLDFMFDYHYMIRSIKERGLDWTIEHNELARKFYGRLREMKELHDNFHKKRHSNRYF